MNRFFALFIVASFWLTAPPFFLYAMEICQEPEQAREIANALTICEQARQIYHDSGQSDDEADVLLTIGNLHLKSGRFSEAVRSYQQAGTVTTDSYLKMIAGASLATAHTQLGESEKAIDGYHQAKWHSNRSEKTAELGQILLGMGVAYSKIGKYEEALNCVREAWNIFQANLEQLNIIAMFSLFDHDYGTPIGLYETVDMVEMFLTIGSIYDALGEQNHRLQFFFNAVDHYLNALTACRTLKTNLGFADVGREEISIKEGLILNNIGKTFFYIAGIQKNMAGEFYARAIGNYQHSLQVTTNAPSIHAKTLFNLGQTHVELSAFGATAEHLAQAVQFLEAARAMQEEQREMGELWQTLGLLARTHERLGRVADAQKFYADALDTLEAFFAAAGTQDFKISLGDQRAVAETYQNAAAFLMRSGKPEEAFIASERARARAFLDRLGSLPANRKKLDAGLRQKELELQQELAGISAALAKADGGRRLELEAEFEAINTEHAAIIAQIDQQDPEYGSLRHVQLPSLDTLNDELDEQITLLSYFTTPENTYAFVIAKGAALHAQILNIGHDELATLVDCVRRFNGETCAKDAYRRLIAPIRSQLNGKKVGVIPHGELHRLPFAALTRADGTFFSQEFHLFMLPSAASWTLLTLKTFSTRPTLLGLANGEAADGFSALRGAVLETKWLLAYRRLFRADVFVSCDDEKSNCREREATESRFKRDAPNYDILHLAAHGKFDPASRTPSLLLLSPDSENDGRLEEREVREFDLSNTNLVVLSGCSTQLGTQSRGDEVVGLSRAFLFAGASSVLASLWDIEDDATQDFMKAFYFYLGLTHDKTRAIRFAQNAMRSNENKHYRNPYYWAGFTLVGMP